MDRLHSGRPLAPEVAHVARRARAVGLRRRAEQVRAGRVPLDRVRPLGRPPGRDRDLAARHPVGQGQRDHTGRRREHVHLAPDPLCAGLDADRPEPAADFDEGLPGAQNGRPVPLEPSGRVARLPAAAQRQLGLRVQSADHYRDQAAGGSGHVGVPRHSGNFTG